MELKQSLSLIASLPGVIGSLIVGLDGTPVANELPEEYDPDSVGSLSLGMYINASKTLRKMAHDRLHVLIARSDFGYLAIVLVEEEGKLLITLSSEQTTDELVKLMRSIMKLLAV